MAIGEILPETSLVIDTDILTDWRYRQAHVVQKIGAYISRAKKPPALTSMSVFEALYGFEKQAVKVGGLDERTTEDRESTETLIRSCLVLPLNEVAASIAAYIFPRLSKSDQNNLCKDLFIAATAVAHGYGLVTRNQRDFALIASHLPPSRPFLRLAIWKP